MFIAHVPSGYILSVALLKRIRRAPVSALSFALAGMLGALAPDLDLAYFYLIDHRQTHHHKYVSHWPILWLSLMLANALWFRFAKKSAPAALALLFSAGGVLHVILDSVVGDIWWFAPFIDKPYVLFTVAASFTPWWLNFILHWSFALELAICVWALVLYRRRRAASART
jgi:membrane-bound metal-dependent hydrolase YbcI (DUF457 family)